MGGGRPAIPKMGGTWVRLAPGKLKSPVCRECERLDVLSADEKKTHLSASPAWRNIAHIREHEHPILTLSVSVEIMEQHLRVLETFFQEFQDHLFPLLGHHGDEASQRLHHDLDGDRGRRHVDDHGVDLRHEDVCGPQNLLYVRHGHGEFHACLLGGIGLCPGPCGRPDRDPCNHGLCDVRRHVFDVRGPHGTHGRRGLDKKKEKQFA